MNHTISTFIWFLISDVLNPLIILLVALAFVVFLWGLVKYVSAGGNDEKLAEGAKLMVYGIVVLFVMVSAWGFVKILENTFNFSDATVGIPQSTGGIQ
jgi:predicted histidine transporter YuiF (NhaC family)